MPLKQEPHRERSNELSRRLTLERLKMAGVAFDPQAPPPDDPDMALLVGLVAEVSDGTTHDAPIVRSEFVKKLIS